MDEGNEDILLLSTSDNGCTPRITNLGFYNRSDSVVSFRNGHSLPAKIKENMGSHIHDERYIEFDDWTQRELCSSTSQIVDIKPLKDKYIAGILDWYNMVRTGDDAPTVPCDIPENDPGEWTMLRIGTMATEKYDGKCDVRMEPHLETDHSFTMNFKDCFLKKKDKSRKVFNGSFTMEFTCLGIAEDNDYDDACVFTKTQPNEILNHDYVSWVIPDYDRKVFMYYVGSCAHTTKVDIVKEHPTKKAIATLAFDRYAGPSVNHCGDIILIFVTLTLLVLGGQL